MSPRHKRIRKVINPPRIKGYKPYGPDVSEIELPPVVLLFEEYEALRLCDYDQMNHHEASVEMQVSRPTFTRIYGEVRRKIATAFVEGRQITIEGGKVYFDSDWYHCHACNCHFNNPEKDIKIEKCPLCGSKNVESAVNTDSIEGKDNNCLDEPCGKETRRVGKGRMKK
jgi:uncharacterized protein